MLKKNTESANPFNIISDVSVKESTKSCYLNQSPFMHFPQSSIPAGIVDLESRMRNQDTPLSRCDSGNSYYDLNRPECTDCSNCSNSLPCDCLHCLTSKEHTNGIMCEDNGLIPTYSRINRPCDILSGIIINRAEPLCYNPQDENHLPTNDIIGINTRTFSRDSYDNSKK
ncbi:MAG: hypothetical protein PHX34_04470 [Candidatus Shapirobacteria bacterium]|nr:hypothetical protein [Candidatus Shapirobacteria bacterium]